MTWGHLIGLLLGALALCYSLTAWLALLLRRPSVRRSDQPEPEQPPVTILKPLCGAEADLLECLRSFCQQDYPRFQIVFGVRDTTDPAVAVVQSLQGEFPHLDLVIATNAPHSGSSRKVSNLINMMPLARHEYLVIADSDVRVAPDYLAKVVPPLLDSRVGIVTCPYLGRPRPGLWSLVASVFVNEWFMPSARIAALFGSRAFAFGATIAIRREVLTAIGGFAVIANQLADDYRLGELTRRVGLRTVLSEVVVETCMAERSLGELVRHELRWLRTIRAVRPLGYSFAFISFGVPVAVAGAVLSRGSAASLIMLALTVTARLMLHAIVRGPRLSATPPWVLPVSDFLAFALWCWGFVTSHVHWRDIRYRVARDGSLHPIL